MRHTVLIAVILLAATQVYGQEIAITPKLREGDKFRLELIRIRENSTRPQQNGKSRTEVNVEVISAAPEEYVLDWAPGETEFDNPQIAQDPLVAAASEIAEDMRFRITLNGDGEFTGVANEAEIAPKLQAMVDTMIQQISANIPAEQRETFLGFINQVLSPSALISSATREAQIYFGLHGAALEADEVVEVDTEMPSPLGGGSIPAVFRIKMDSVTSDSASLTTTTTYDADALRAMTLALMEQAGGAVPPDRLAEIPPMKMADDAKYLFDRTVGLMREVMVNRRISAPGAERYDGWEIRMLDRPAR